MARRPPAPPSPAPRPPRTVAGRRPDFSIEAGLIAAGVPLVAGCDEVGRGPLAGPVVAAAVILDPACVPEGLDDSKRLSAAEREALFGAITGTALALALASVPASGIDAGDIRRASLLAMRRAVAGLALAPGHVLIDGRDVPEGLGLPATALVGGDGRSASIAAASILAKVLRDRMMARADGAFPGYGFGRHVGYGTAAHRAAIARLGPSPLHRLSFRPLRDGSF